MHNSHNKSRLTYSLFFVLISQMLFAQTWEEVKMHILPDDTMGFHWSSNICFTNKDTGWISTIGAEKNESGNYDLVRKIFRTQNGGNTWGVKFISSQKFKTEYANTYSIYSMEPDYFIAMYNDSVAGVLISEDGGETWIDSKMANEHLASNISEIHFFDSRNGIAFNDNRWFTTNAGYTWEKGDDLFENESPDDVCFFNHQLGWIVSSVNKYATDSGYLANTIDGGRTWQYQDSIAVILTGVDFIDSLNGFAVGTDFKFSTAFIYSTIDGGIHWDIEQFCGEGSYKDIGFLDDNHGWILASGGKILRTCDGGANWETQIDNLDCNFGKLRILNVDRMAYAVGYNMDNHTLVIYRADLSGLTGIIKDEMSLPHAISLYQNYPNPFNSQTTIRYIIYQNTYVVLKIFNILGEEVRTLVSRNHNPGNYQVNWNGTSNSGKPLESGIYICQLIISDRMERMKLILLK